MSSARDPERSPSEFEKSRAQRDPEGVFAAFLAAAGRGEEHDFEAWCARHADLAGELRALHADWERVQGLLARLGATQTLSQRIESLFGPVDPEVSLGEPDDAGGPSAPTRSGSSAERIEKLALHSGPQQRYSTRDEIGRGGMGAVYRVWDEDLRRSLAMKVVLGRKEFLGETERVEIEPHKLARFLEEAQITSQLDHPGIVPVHELGIDLHGRVYFTMRLVRGKSLREIIEYVHAPDLAREDGVREIWTLPRALDVVLRVTEAMAYAHSKKVVHRDLKPSNIMVGRFGETYVMDWGLAKVQGRADTRNLRIREDDSRDSQSSVRTDRVEEASQTGTEAPLVTMDGDVVGTPVYMSPEQARGRVEEIDEQSDVYGVGALLYHLIGGERPFIAPGERATPQRVLAALRKGPPTALAKLAPDAPPELVAICEKAMARVKADRYANCQDLARDLRAFLEGRVVSAYESGAWAEFKKWVGRNKPLAASIAAGISAVVLGLAAVGLVQARARKIAENERERADVARWQAQVAEGRATRALAELVELSGARHVKTLLDREFHELWPALPERVADYEAWLAGARAIRERLPEYALELERLRARASAPSPLDVELERRAKEPLELALEGRRSELRTLETLVDASPQPLPEWLERRDALRAEVAARQGELAERTIWRFADPADGARHDLLAEAVSFGRSLDLRIANVEWRTDTARHLEERTVSGPLARARWRAALASLHADARFATAFEQDFELEPRLGLLPLWQDSQSGLWEFLWAPSGEAPVRDPDTGRIELDEASGIVLVLVPGGTFRLGCDLPGPGRQLGDPNVDPGCRSAYFEDPSQEVRLDPFFLSKFETTQAQWQRVWNANPSHWKPDPSGLKDPTTYTLTHPVESVSWNDCRQFVARLGLELPTEARWEFAARAGTTGVYWCGGESASLEGVENIASLELELDPNYGRSLGNVELFRDGWAYTAPVGSLAPNPFGLYDTLGNVHEWCSEYDFTTPAQARDGDGLRELTASPYRLVKGGSCIVLASSARSAFHAGIPPDAGWNSIGLRTALPGRPR